MKSRTAIIALLFGLTALVFGADKWGFIDTSGKTVIRPQFEDIGWFHGGRAIVNLGGGIVFIDRKGEVVARPAYARGSGKSKPGAKHDYMFVFALSDGLAEARTAENTGYVNDSGRTVIEPRFLSGGDFNDGLAPVLTSEHWGYIDRTGRMAIEPRFTLARAFSEGLACADTGGEDVLGILDHEGARSGYVDKSGKFVIAPVFGKGRRFSEGLAVVQDAETRLFGAVNSKGETVIPCVYVELGDFHDGLAYARNEDGNHGFLDATGKGAVRFDFEDAGDFAEGRAAVRTGGEWGYVDKSGKLVIPAQFDDACQFAEGFAAVKVGDQWGFIRPDGTFAISPRFSWDSRRAFSFSEGLCAVPLPE
jgi:hypothetical protein